MIIELTFEINLQINFSYLKVDHKCCSTVDHIILKYVTDNVFYMRTCKMIDNFGKHNGLTLDTCFVIQAYKNPGIASFYFQKGLYGCKIFINEIVLNEAEHIGFDKTKLLLKMKEIFGQVILKDVTNEERIFGQHLEKLCPILHPGDSSILAFTKRTSTILVTLDKNLAKSCEFFDVDCILFQIVRKHGGQF